MSEKENNEKKLSVRQLVLRLTIASIGITSFVMLKLDVIHGREENAVLLALFIASIIGIGILTFWTFHRKWGLHKAIVVSILVVYLLIVALAFAGGSLKQVKIVEYLTYPVVVILVFSFVQILFDKYLQTKNK